MKERTVYLYKDKELLLEKETDLEVKDIIAKINEKGYDYDKIKISFNNRNKVSMEIGNSDSSIGGK